MKIVSPLKNYLVLNLFLQHSGAKINGEFTYNFFDNVDENFDIPRVGLRAVVLILTITPDTTTWSRDGLQEKTQEKS